MRIISFLLFCSVFSLSLFSQNATDHIHVDQFGYLPNSTKVAVVSDPITGYNSGQSYTPDVTLSLIDVLSGNSVFSASPEEWSAGSTHDQSGDKGWWFDFSTVTTPGTYYILDASNNTKSYDFQIGDEVYYEVLKSATKMFYYNRCNMPKEVPYAEPDWTDGDNFENALQDSFCRYVFDPDNASLERDLSGGWFDAGDYNKYVTFAVKPVHQLLYAYQESSDVFTDDWNIPESGNGISDLIDELKWELDWLLKMTNADGSTILKMGSTNFQNFNSPPSNNFVQRYYGPTCTSASIAAAGILAHAALVYEGITGLDTYASTLESQAISCFAYALPALNNDQLETACDDGTINAGDADWDVDQQRQRAVLAAIYLWELTGNNIYHDYIKNNINDVNFISGDWVGNDSNEELEALLHYSTLQGADQAVINELNSSINPHITQDWNGFFGMNETDLYRSYIPDWAYHWGSSLSKSDFAILNHIIKTYDVNPSQNTSYDIKAAEHVHYFHGINPQNIVYLSNMYSLGGDNCVNEIYHGWFNDGTDYDHALNSLYGPAPGFVSGGANKDFTVTTISPPYGQPDQKSYLDFNDGFPSNSWEISEPAIYYQAAYIRLLALYTNKPCANNNVLYLDSSASGTGDGESWTDAYVSISSLFEDECISSVDTIKIASGTYTPTTTDRSFGYPIDHDIVIVGGYSSGGTSYDPSIYETILSGNIGSSILNTDNLYHAIDISTPNISVQLSGLTISGGNADGSNSNAIGAGIYGNANITLDNVKVKNNIAINGNDIIYIEDLGSMTIIGNTIISNNSN